MALSQLIIGYAQASEKKFYPLGPFASVTLAQYGDESAWGSEVSGVNNFFGIKATSAQIASGKATRRVTHETLSNGQYVQMLQYFANYDSPQDCFDAHATLLCTPHYLACQQAQTPEAYCMALEACGYATGEPGHPYGPSIYAIIASMNLTQYDVQH